MFTKTSVDRKTATKAVKKIRKFLDEYSMQYSCCGEYERGCKEIDYLEFVAYIPVSIMNLFVTEILIEIDSVEFEEEVVMFEIEGVNVKIYMSNNKDRFGAMLFYHNSSAKENLLIRRIAKQNGYTLNQSGLYKGKKIIPVGTEQELYKILGQKYKSPKTR